MSTEAFKSTLEASEQKAEQEDPSNHQPSSSEEADVEQFEETINDDQEDEDDGADDTSSSAADESPVPDIDVADGRAEAQPDLQAESATSCARFPESQSSVFGGSSSTESQKSGAIDSFSRQLSQDSAASVGYSSTESQQGCGSGTEWQLLEAVGGPSRQDFRGVAAGDFWKSGATGRVSQSSEDSAASIGNSSTESLKGSGTELQLPGVASCPSRQDSSDSAASGSFQQGGSSGRDSKKLSEYSDAPISNNKQGCGRDRWSQLPAAVSGASRQNSQNSVEVGVFRLGSITGRSSQISEDSAASIGNSSTESLQCRESGTELQLPGAVPGPCRQDSSDSAASRSSQQGGTTCSASKQVLEYSDAPIGNNTKESKQVCGSGMVSQLPATVNSASRQNSQNNVAAGDFRKGGATGRVSQISKDSATSIGNSSTESLKGWGSGTDFQFSGVVTGPSRQDSPDSTASGSFQQIGTIGSASKKLSEYSTSIGNNSKQSKQGCGMVSQFPAPVSGCSRQDPPDNAAADCSSSSGNSYETAVVCDSYKSSLESGVAGGISNSTDSQVPASGSGSWENIAAPAPTPSENVERENEPGESTEGCGFFTRILRKSKTYFIMKLIMLVLSISALSMGFVYCNDCPMEPGFPIIFIMMGITSLFLLFCSFVMDLKQVLTINVNTSCIVMAVSISRCIFMVEFVCALILTYHQTPSFDPTSNGYCNEIFYHYAFYVNIVFFIVQTAWLFVVCRCDFKHQSYERL